jgi:hypothetical protein
MAEMPLNPTYHVSIWDADGPTYVCLLCQEARGLTVAGVTVHLREVHDADAIPTEGIERLCALRAEADARVAAAPQGSETPAPIPPEEPAHG